MRWLQSEKVSTVMAATLFVLALILIGFPSAPVSVNAQSKGSVTVASIADMTGDGAAHAIQSSVTTARWVVVLASSSNTSTARTGDSSISASQGAPILPGGSFMYPAIPSAPGMRNADQYYDVSAIYYLATTGDKVSVLWGK